RNALHAAPALRGYNVSMRVGINAHLLSFSGSYRQAGLSRYIDELLFELPRVAPDLQITGFTGNEAPPASALARRPSNLTLAPSRFPTQRAPVRIAWEQAVLPGAALRHRLDLLHCPVNVRPLLSPCPTVVTIHDLVFLRSPQSFHPAKRRYLSAMTGWSARHASHVIAVSDSTRQDVIDLLGVRPSRVTTVHNGVGEQFKPLDAAERSAFQAQQGIVGRTILYVGTLEPRKNLPMLIRAFARLSEDPAFEDVKLYIGGSKGWYYEEIFATAERLGLTQSGRVTFLGRVPDEQLPLWYNVATVVAYPSLYEGFGLPALEAMSCGTPVLASNASSLPEVVGSGGLLLDPADDAAWLDALRAVLSDDALRADLAGKALKQAAAFSWTRSARETAEVYRWVQNRRGSKQSEQLGARRR
ncbi:MAG TPA: glycosyltransferase family 1 protein, partial [Chloroflexia bacterium]|nr:glycosyltransferase family 1 protein [Chloroflexia bacterium]